VTPFCLVTLSGKSEERAASVFTDMRYMIMIIEIHTAIIISIILSGTLKLKKKRTFLSLKLMEVLKNAYQSRWYGGITFIRNVFKSLPVCTVTSQVRTFIIVAVIT
jgi:hypothetical protein